MEEEGGEGGEWVGEDNGSGRNPGSEGVHVKPGDTEAKGTLHLDSVS